MRNYTVLAEKVALLAEGVDRNWLEKRQWDQNRWSPSSRRAWIEMLHH